MCDTLTKLGSMDSDDEQDVARVLGQVRELADLCRRHLHHENEFVHTALEARHTGSAQQAAHEHIEHEEAIEQLFLLTGAVENAEGAERANVATQLYRYLVCYVAENFIHMNMEETEHNAVLWVCYTDEELIGIEQAIVASLPPEEMALVMRWMIPSMPAAERAKKLAGIRKHAGKLVEALGLPKAERLAA
jgi:hypothetical protein